VSNQDAAAVLGIVPNAAAQRYHRALSRLRQHLPPELRELMPEASA
jgi:DNA-directed RNA polymerase specialized sigma24 family protein